MILFLACMAADDTTTHPPRQGPKGPDDTEEIEDRNEPPEDTGTIDTGDGDTGEPIEPEPSLQEVCYPGADESWTACIDVVDWDSSWGSDYAYSDPYNGSAQYAKPIRFIDLNSADPDMELAPNFVLDEFMQQWKGRFAIYQPHAVERMQEIRDRVGGPATVNSGYRNVAYNASVGGAEYSRHMYGDACDFKSSSASLGALGEICDDLGAGYVGYYDTHVHCDWRNDPLEPAFYDAGRSGIQHPEERFAAEIVRDGGFRAPAEGWDEGEPLREWVALDADGNVLAEHVGPVFDPPLGSASVEVVVGRELRLNAPVD